MVNVTTVTNFLLMGFSDIWELQLIHAALFLLVYLAALTGNLLIVAITTLDRRFYSPMYFFLKHLSILDLCYISVTVPKSIANSLTNSCSIYYWGCVAQLFLTIMLAISELFVLTVMSYDRYVAICRPLHYEVIMNRGACVQMAAATWFSGGLLGAMYSAGTFTLSFCRTNMIQQFFCDVPSLLNISCSERHIVVDVSVAIGMSFGFISFVSIIISYIYIFSTVLTFPSTESRSKAFSTCLPHLAVIMFFLSTGACAYLKPPSDFPSTLDLMVSVFYTVVPPTLNPLIYSLRNRDMKAALWEVWG